MVLSGSGGANVPETGGGVGANVPVTGGKVGANLPLRTFDVARIGTTYQRHNTILWSVAT